MWKIIIRQQWFNSGKLTKLQVDETVELTKQLCRLTVDETVVDETVVDETVS
jgi:hypothetical protein